VFDIGFWELAVIGLTALIVVGPEQLPGLARKAGLYVAQAKRLLRQVRMEVERDLQAEEFEQARRIAQSDLGNLKRAVETPVSELLTDAPASGSPGTTAATRADAGQPPTH
jgi:sec-independent protein translocase protein TatB